MAVLKYYDQPSATYVTLPGLPGAQGPTGAAGPTGPTGATGTASQVSCRAHRAAAYSILTSLSPLAWDVVDLDTNGAYNTSTGAYTIPVAGRYRVSGQIMGTVAGTNQLQVSIYRNGVLFCNQQSAAVTTAQNLWAQAIDTVNCSVGDTITFQVNATTQVGLNPSPYNSFMTIDLLGAGVGPTGAVGPTGPSGTITDSGWHWVNGPGEPTSSSATYDTAGNSWSAPRFRRDAAGCVFLDGLFGGVPAGPITFFTLPPGYRPAYELRFETTPGVYIRVLPTGDVICAANSVPASYNALNGVTFMAEDYQSINWTYPTPQNGWTNLGQGCAPLRYFLDSAGDAHLSGVITGGAAANTIFMTSFTWDFDQIFAAACAPGSGTSTCRIDCHASGGINTNGYIGGGTNAWVSLDGIVISNVGGTWWAPALSNSWVNYGGGWAGLGFSINKNGVVSMRGLVRSGTTTGGTLIAAAGAIPYPPTYQIPFFQSANAGQARCDAATNGGITFQQFFSGGTNGYVAVQGRWLTEASEGSGASQQGAIGPTGATGPAGASSPLLMSVQTLTAPTVAASPYTITHNLGTTNVLVQMYDAVTQRQVQAQVAALNTNQIQVSVATNMPNNVNVVIMGAPTSPISLFPGDLATKAYVDARTPNLPAPITSGSGVNSFTDALGDVWVAANGVYNGAWKRATDVMHSRVTRNSAFNITTTITHLGMDGVINDPYGIYASGWTVPIGGVWLLGGVAGMNTIANGWFRFRYYLNSVFQSFLGLISLSTAIGGVCSFTSMPLKLNAGDIVQIFADGSATTALLTGVNYTTASLDYLGAG